MVVVKEGYAGMEAATASVRIEAQTLPEIRIRSCVSW